MRFYLQILAFYLMSIVPVWAADVLLIESYHKEYGWDESYIRGLESTLGDDVTLHTFEMDTKRLPKSQFDAQADKALAIYQEISPDVVVLGDDNALSYMLPRLKNEDIDIVFLGINSNPRRLMAKYAGTARVTGVLERPLFARSMKEMSELLGKDQMKVKILFDAGTTATIATDHIANQYEDLKQQLGIDATIENHRLFSSWKSSVEQADEYDAIVVGLYQIIRDESDNVVDANKVLSWTNENSETPLFGFWDFSVGKGQTAGGVVLFGESQGVQAGKYVNRILSGEDASTISVIHGKKGRAIYSATEFERWGLTPLSHWRNID
ncbi:ABC transporter substrate-binding protein [Salinivibrio sp. ES.052]|uniref:ABC transporter substrate-binding protein n=1 Tax=Salinivibrio sp. ES.052 TaxID=1882823 RepID=UPI00092A63A2|nr:hypothetical protein [Salinivibrio sp. ES.052]SIN90249.1 ABC transporter substrate binding protein [Salinivibrio sp. ES.052]